MSKSFKMLTNLIIIVLAVLFLFFTGMGLYEIHESSASYTTSEDSMLYDLQYYRYSSLVDAYHRNTAAGANTTETMEECYAIARYYEAAIDYKLAVQENDAAAKQAAGEKMTTAADEMGSLSYAKAEIDELLDF